MRKSLAAIIILMLLAGVGYWLRRPSAKTATLASKNAAQQFDKAKHSRDDPASLWVIVNKRRALPDSYAPTDLVVPNTKLRLGSGAEEMQVRRDTAGALEQLITTAKKQGYDLMLVSGYRSQATQTKVYNSYVKQSGQAVADRESARPGYSEHQTGWAADIGRVDRKCELEACFGTTAEGQWLVAHAHEYGFVLRYAQGAEQTTGYQYEPWHFRYVGKDLAGEVHRAGAKTLEDFFGLPPAPSY